MKHTMSLMINQIANIIRHKLQEDGINCCNDDELDKFETYVKKLLVKNLEPIQHEKDKET